MKYTQREREHKHKSIHISAYSAHTLTVLGYRVVENNDSNGSYNGNGGSASTKSKKMYSTVSN